MKKTIIHGGTVVTMAPEGILDPGIVVIEKDRIKEIVPDRGIKRYLKDNSVRLINAAKSLVIPGLIDSHFHTCQQGLRGIFPVIARMNLPRWPGWKWYLIPWESRLSVQDAYHSAMLAYGNMLKVGTTCFAEHGGRFPEKMAQAMEEVGVRGLLAISTMDMDTGEPKLPPNMLFTTKEAIDKNEELVKKWPFRGEQLARGVFSLRQIIVCSPKLIETTVHLAEEQDTMVQTHANEGHYEISYALEKHGLRPIEYLAKINGLSSRVIAAHSVLMSEREVEILAEKGVGVAHCPSGNLSGLGMAHLPLMKRLGVDIGLGSDGGAWGSLSLFREMWVTLVAQNQVFGAGKMDRSVASAEEVFKMATIGGAKVLGLEDEIGSLEVGKRADIVILDKLDLDCTPSRDAYFTLVNAFSGRPSIKFVFVNGRLVVENGKLALVSEEWLKNDLSSRLYQKQDEFFRDLKNWERR